MDFSKSPFTLALLIVGIVLTVSGCGQGSKSEAQGSKSEAQGNESEAQGNESQKADCSNNLYLIGANASQLFLENNKLTIEGLAFWLGRSGKQPECPSGSPYFICSPTNYEIGEKVFAYCPKHLIVLKGGDSLEECDASEFRSQIKTNLLNNNDIAAELGKTVANALSQKTEPTDANPTGTWTSGDRNSVYSRLTVRASGTFSFETVDFTGDVKGGYSGTWRMDGKSVRFEWGGIADSGSCSGRRTGRDTLVFGSTTFSR